MLVRMWHNNHSPPVGMESSTSSLEDSLTVSYNSKHTHSICSSNCASWYLPKGVDNLCPHENLLMAMYNNFIQYCKTWKQTRCPLVTEQITKQWCILVVGFSTKNETKIIIKQEKTWRNLKWILLSERSQNKKTTYCMIPAIWYSGERKTKKTIKRTISSC